MVNFKFFILIAAVFFSFQPLAKRSAFEREAERGFSDRIRVLNSLDSENIPQKQKRVVLHGSASCNQPVWPSRMSHGGGAEAIQRANVIYGIELQKYQIKLAEYHRCEIEKRLIDIEKKQGNIEAFLLNIRARQFRNQ